MTQASLFLDKRRYSIVFSGAENNPCHDHHRLCAVISASIAFHYGNTNIEALSNAVGQSVATAVGGGGGIKFQFIGLIFPKNYKTSTITTVFLYWLIAKPLISHFSDFAIRTEVEGSDQRLHCYYWGPHLSLC